MARRLDACRCRCGGLAVAGIIFSCASQWCQCAPRPVLCAQNQSKANKGGWKQKKNQNRTVHTRLTSNTSHFSACILQKLQLQTMGRQTKRDKNTI